MSSTGEKHENRNDYKIVLARCPECKKERRLSFFADENTRYTFCITCGKAVLWEEIGG